MQTRTSEWHCVKEHRLGRDNELSTGYIHDDVYVTNPYTQTKLMVTRSWGDFNRNNTNVVNPMFI
jgi:hypothetical protein